jgi:diguanylate cyclase (GGDEF)-like protein
MLSSLSATEVAFVQISVLQAVAAAVWALGAWFVRVERVAAAHWAAYSALSSLTWLLLAQNLGSPPLLGVLCGVLSALALRQGIRHFTRQVAGWRLGALAFASVLAAASVGGGSAAPGPLQAGVNFGVLAVLYLAMARDLHAHARDTLQWRWPLFLALPVLLGGLGFGARALRALLAPESVLMEMRTHSALNVVSALSYTVLVLMLHSMLMALVVGRLLRDLRRLARRDGLTGLLNRHAMHEMVDAQVLLHRRAADTFCVLMVDVDHFKSVNDRYGHAVGDRALRHIAGQMTQALAPKDRVGRLGGEEFLVLLPACTMARALAEAERLRLAVRQAPLAEGAALVVLSVSIGVAAWRGGDEDTARLLARADDALYRAKARGRDCVVEAEPAEDRRGAGLPAPPVAR